MNKTIPSNFYLLVFGDFITKLGDYIYQLVLPILVLQITNSPIWSGLSFAITQVGVIVSGVISGSVIDRWNPKHIMCIGAGFMAILTVSIPISSGFHNLFIPWVMIASFLLEILNFSYRSCLNSIIPLIVKKDKIPTTTAILSFSRFLSKTCGPIIGGFLIAAVGATSSLFVDSITFILLIIVNLFVSVPTAQYKQKQKINLISDTLCGIKYIFKRKELLLLNIINFMANIGYVPLLSMFVVHLTKTIGLNSKTTGMIYSVDGIAALIGGLLIPWIMKRISVGHEVMISCVILGTTIALLGYCHNPILIGILFFLALISAQVSNKSIYSYWQMTVPQEYLGRVYGLSSTIESLATPLSAICAGLIAQYYSTTVLFLISGLIVVFTGVTAFASRTMRSIGSEIEISCSYE